MLCNEKHMFLSILSDGGGTFDNSFYILWIGNQKIPERKNGTRKRTGPREIPRKRKNTIVYFVLAALINNLNY